MSDIIKATNLSKSFGNVNAVSGIDLNVRQGEIYGFLGLNGAGKTTTIRMMLGMITPTAGEVEILEQTVRPGATELWAKIGYLVETPHAYPALTVRENLELIRRLRHIQELNAVDSVIEILHLERYADRKAGHLSLGNAQRLGLAKALIHHPEILILDEPTNGFDPEGIVDIRDMLSDLAGNHGVTIFISSHILGEISRFATRIGIIHDGEMVKEIDADSLKTLTEKFVAVSTRNNEKAIALLKKQYSNVTLNDHTIRIKDVSAIQQADRIAEYLVKEKCSPQLLKVEEEDLETFFLRSIGRPV